jgi:hypothetical protein
MTTLKMQTNFPENHTATKGRSCIMELITINKPTRADIRIRNNSIF